MIGGGSLTEQQQRFAENNDEAFVQACPGAGKTRTVVARLAEIGKRLPPRHGVAVLSFTNSAVEEFIRRCTAAGLDCFLRHPSFIGTFDAFVRHFIVLPGGITGASVRPVIVDSWDSLEVEIRLSGQYAFRGDGVSLDLFDAETNAIDPARIGHTGLQNHVRQYRDRYEQAARATRRRLNAAGYLSAGDARIEARDRVRDPLRGKGLGCALAARFHEIIVDEGQDCNPHDLEILIWLRQHGVRVSVVCDPDQAIYSFRHCDPDGLRTLRNTYPQNCQLFLSGNFRSSPPICSMAATLRNAGDVDTAVGCTGTVTHPVVLLTYVGRGPGPIVGLAFLAQAEAVGLKLADVIVLAHARNVAQRTAGDPASGRQSVGGSRVETFARIVAGFWSSAATSRSREMTLRSVETLLLTLMGKRSAGEHLTRTIRREGLDARLLRRQALSVVMGVPRACPNSDGARAIWIARLHAEVERLELDLQPGQSVRGFFRRPPNEQWSSHLQPSDDLHLIAATIHEAKGREYDGVCVVIPPDRAPRNYTSELFDSWENRVDHEAKRVIYVGITRARRLGVLAVPALFGDRCAAVLELGKVPFVRRDLAKSD